MPLSWSALHAQLLRSTTTRTFHDACARIRLETPILTPLSDPGALIPALHGDCCAPEEKNALLRALVRHAQRPDAGGNVATTLLLLALWPGLDAAYGRLRRSFPGAREDLACDVSARATVQIKSLDLRKVRKIAATVVRNVERDIRRALITRAAEERTELDGTQNPDLVVSEAASAESALLAGELLRFAGADAALLFAVDVEGHTLAEAASRLGIGCEAARKRRQRALQKLRENCAIS